MKNIVASMLALSVIAAASSGLAADGEYYTGVKPASRIDRSHTGSIGQRDGMQVKTSRDNRMPVETTDRGDYYEGAQQPQ
jgi:hypothetical protein